MPTGQKRFNIVTIINRREYLRKENTFPSYDKVVRVAFNFNIPFRIALINTIFFLRNVY